MYRKLTTAAAACLTFALGGSAFAQTAPAPADAAPPAAAPPDANPPSPPAPGATAPAANAPADALEKRLSSVDADNTEQDTRIAELEAKLKQLEAKLSKATEKAPPGSAAAGAASAPPQANGPAAPSPFKVSGYAQGQYESHQDSEDQLLIGGAPLNQNRFLLRRARVKVERQWASGGLLLELDANTVRGPSLGIQHAEISIAHRNEAHEQLIGVTVGIFDNPFGREVVESPRTRAFMERSFGSREFFPAEPDLGVRLAGQLGWFRYSAAIVNGQPLGDRSGFVLQDPNAHKDVLGRLGVALDVTRGLNIAGGVSVLDGKGFHAGTDPTKNVLIWKDSNENGTLDLGETRAAPGTARVASQNFERWAVGADLAFCMQSALGVSTLAGEVIAGSNMGRNVFVADPVTTSIDERELGYYLLLVHEFGFGALAGFRFDTYNPDADFLDSKRQGKLIPTDETVTTYAPIVGFQVPNAFRLIGEYDFIHDAFARDARGVPTDKKNDVWTLRLQGEL